MNSFSIVRSSILGLIVSAAFASGAVMAQDTQSATVPGHPRVNEVNQRLQNQQNRVQKGVAGHQIGAKQEARDQKTDANIAKRESNDEARHNGHLTKQEKSKLNKSENRDSRRIRRQRTGV